MLRGSLQRDSANRRSIMSKYFTDDLSLVLTKVPHQIHFHHREEFGKNHRMRCFEIIRPRQVHSFSH
jgi:hypothetical protein